MAECACSEGLYARAACCGPTRWPPHSAQDNRPVQKGKRRLERVASQGLRGLGKAQACCAQKEGEAGRTTHRTLGHVHATSKEEGAWQSWPKEGSSCFIRQRRVGSEGGHHAWSCRSPIDGCSEATRKEEGVGEKNWKGECDSQGQHGNCKGIPVAWREAQRSSCPELW